MNYQEARAYAQSLEAKGIRPGLDRIKKLLGLLGQPQEKLNVIHVAGTNGKGSVCTFMSSILLALNYKVGRYISPSVNGYRERFQMNGSWIAPEIYAGLMTEIRETIEKHFDEADQPTSFETETALAYLYFYREGCDFAVVETGMGGLEDASNVESRPVLCLITSIAMDHMAFLGNTLSAIAAQKGGIIKDGCPVLLGGIRGEALEVLTQICLEKNAVMQNCDFNGLVCKARDLKKGQTFMWKSFENLHIGMAAPYQLRNAVVAASGILMLFEFMPENAVKQVALPDIYQLNAAIVRGLEKATWPGRFELLQEEPMILLDGAHNPDGVSALIEGIKCYEIKGRIICLMAVFKDKDYSEMVTLLSSVSDTLLIYKPEGARGLAPELLAETAAHSFHKVLCFESQKEALDHALEIAASDDLILACGSLSTQKTLRNLLNQRNF